MRLGIYSVYDSKAKAYLPPFFLPNDALAVRAVVGCTRDPDHSFAKFPLDYSLHKMGSFDDQSGRLEVPDSGPEFLYSLNQIQESE